MIIASLPHILYASTTSSRKARRIQASDVMEPPLAQEQQQPPVTPQQSIQPTERPTLQPTPKPTAQPTNQVAATASSVMRDCRNGLFNQQKSACDCVSPFCHDSNGECNLPLDNCGDNPWADCERGRNCPWWSNPLRAESCTTGPNVSVVHGITYRFFTYFF